MKVFNVRRRYFKVLSFIVLRYERIEEESEEKLYVLDKLEIFRSGVWYNCSEFGDSVFFQENFSFSNLDIILFEEEEGVFEIGVEIII